MVSEYGLIKLPTPTPEASLSPRSPIVLYPISDHQSALLAEIRLISHTGEVSSKVILRRTVGDLTPMQHGAVKMLCKHLRRTSKVSVGDTDDCCSFNCSQLA